MRILFFTDNFPPETNAIATRVYERACYWVEWGHDVTVLTSAPNFPQGKVYPPYRNNWCQVETIDGIRVVRVKTFMQPNSGVVFRTLDFLSYMVMAFITGLFQRRPDVVISTSPQFFCAVAAWAVAKCRRLTYVFELGDLWPRQIMAVGVLKPNIGLRMIEKLELFLYRQAAAVIALTSAFKDDLCRRGINGEKIRVITNGVDLRRYEPVPRDAATATKYGLEDKFVVGYIGTHGLSHQLENVLDAGELLRENDDIRFLMVGAGAAREKLIAEATKRSLKNVIFVPAQPKNEIRKFWGLCDLALIHLKDEPTFTTVLPSKVFEAMAMGLPLLVVAPRGEISALVETEQAGVWVRSNDPQAFATAVLEMQQNPVRLRNYAMHSLAAAPRYTRERQARDVIRTLEDVVSPTEHLRARPAVVQ